MASPIRSLLACAALACAVVGAAEPDVRPNLLVISIDDLGWGQPGCAGGRLAPTPSIDALAAAGVRCAQGYAAAPVCSPSRVGLLTGRWPARTGHDANTTSRPGTELALGETTMAVRLRDLGYATALVGKWHLGATTPAFLPAARGFERSFGVVGNLGEGKAEDFFRGGERVSAPAGAPVTSPLYAQEACAAIDAGGNAGRPWFLYLAFNAIHAPHAASPAWMERFPDLPHRQRRLAAMIGEVDEAVGTVLGHLRARGCERDTLVVLVGDNGAAGAEADTGGLRGGKWALWEGGIRVPWIAAWPGRIPAGRVVDAPVTQLDILPTALAAAGAAPAAGLDGADLLPLLTGAGPAPAERTLFWRFGPQFAVRRGDWKLVKPGKDAQPLLIDLAHDPGEENDLAATQPERALELQRAFAEWNAAMAPPRWEDGRWDGEEERAERKLRKQQRR